LIGAGVSAGNGVDIKWDKIVGASHGKLNAAQKDRVDALLNATSNTWDCTGSIAKCLASGDRTAARHAGYVVRMVLKGKQDGFIKDGIAKRKDSAHPDEIVTIKNLDQRPVGGNAASKVVVVEYACFQCPYCAHLAPKLKKIGNKAAHYYKFYPVRSHEHGVSTAQAAWAAHKQGKFWKLYDKMYANRENLGKDDVLKYAEQVGLDISKFKADRDSSTAMKAIEADKLEGMRNGVEGTPTFFVNGKLYVGANDITEILDRLDEEHDIVSGKISR
ncbi:MAG: thioredoxin domain-containing protein, partial [Deltaproteobacteria bacterium]|nr:thioredoxin domain-containing protein [Deltaproteobacteria bacterium]